MQMLWAGEAAAFIVTPVSTRRLPNDNTASRLVAENFGSGCRHLRYGDSRSVYLHIIICWRAAVAIGGNC